VNFTPVPGFGAEMVRKYLYECWEEHLPVGKNRKMPEIHFVEKGELKKMYQPVSFTLG
jgi:hypothetical protein